MRLTPFFLLLGCAAHTPVQPTPSPDVPPPMDPFVVGPDAPTPDAGGGPATLEPVAVDAPVGSPMDVDVAAGGLLVPVQNGAAVLLDAAGGAEVRRFAVEDAQMTSVSPDGVRGVVGHYEGLVGVDVASGRTLWSAKTGGNTLALAWANDGASFLDAWDDHAERRDAATGALRWSATLPPPADPDAANSVKALAVSPDGTLVAWSRDRTVALLDGATGKAVRDLGAHGEAVSAVVFAPDGRTVVSGGWDREVRAWAADGSGPRWHAETGGWIAALAVSPSGRTVAVADIAGGLEVRALVDGAWLAAGQLDASSTLQLAWTADGSALWVATGEKLLRVPVPASAR